MSKSPSEKTKQALKEADEINAIHAISAHDANYDLITKQAEQIKVLRSALEDINYELRANDCDDLGWVIRKSFEALESTED